MEDNKEIVDTTDSIEEVILDDTEQAKEAIPEFDYLVISKSDYEKFIAGVEILSNEMKMYLGVLLQDKFKVVPKKESK